MFDPVDVDRLQPDGPLFSPYDKGRAAYIQTQISGHPAACPYFSLSDRGEAWAKGWHDEALDHYTHNALST